MLAAMPETSEKGLCARDQGRALLETHFTEVDDLHRR
jgi:hypothetical protein